ncbi:hypothetical protein GWK46_22340 [Serratia fonticola]|nr:RAQPRD family integrative conjugative element protein [Serratia fonticola]NCG54035.1 hypothetical protein [Serratia fonticola]
MPIIRHRAAMLAGTLLLYALPTFASEQAELGLVLSQLTQMEAALARARAQATQDSQHRFFFDYRRAEADIGLLRQGIEQYLTPSRAQPQPDGPLAGQYRREHPHE